MKKVVTDDRQKFIRELVELKARAGQLGLFKTMHALNEATTAVGYEMADKITRAAKSASKI